MGGEFNQVENYKSSEQNKTYLKLIFLSPENIQCSSRLQRLLLSCIWFVSGHDRRPLPVLHPSPLRSSLFSSRPISSSSKQTVLAKQLSLLVSCRQQTVMESFIKQKLLWNTLINKLKRHSIHFGYLHKLHLTPYCM